MRKWVLTSTVLSIITALTANGVALAQDPAGPDPEASQTFVPPLKSPDLNPAPENANISRSSEDVTISRDAITIDESWMAPDPTKPAHVRFVLSLPEMPPFTASCVNASICAPVANSADSNYFAVTAKIDGKPVSLKVVTKASVSGRDITALLIDEHIPLMTDSKASQDALARLKPETLAKWSNEKDSWVDNEGADAIYGGWTVSSELSFEADIPAGGALSTEIKYQPSVGHGLGANFLGHDEGANHTLVDHEQRYCLDDGFMKSVRKMADNSKPYGWKGLWERQLVFDLLSPVAGKTQAGDFRLVVDKGSNKDDLVSFCGHVVKKLSATSWQVQPFDGEHGTPTKDFEVLFISQPEKN
jgi:hypothetical protein